eukprot:844247-Rhodomonas_salina.2
MMLVVLVVLNHDIMIIGPVALALSTQVTCRADSATARPAWQPRAGTLAPTRAPQAGRHPSTISGVSK